MRSERRQVLLQVVKFISSYVIPRQSGFNLSNRRCVQRLTEMNFLFSHVSEI